MTLGKKDKAVIEAFIEGETLAGHKLSTDGTSLDGHWMGGREIAIWVWVKGTSSVHPGTGKKIRFNDLGSKAAQTVQRAVAKRVVQSWLERP